LRLHMNACCCSAVIVALLSRAATPASDCQSDCCCRWRCVVGARPAYVRAGSAPRRGGITAIDALTVCNGEQGSP
jgi:hypothetical protein